jgi:hypothetical protein
MSTKKAKNPEQISQKRLSEFIAEYLRQHPNESKLPPGDYNINMAAATGGQQGLVSGQDEQTGSSRYIHIARNAAELAVDRLIGENTATLLLGKQTELKEEIARNERQFADLERAMSELSLRISIRRTELSKLSNALANIVSQ